MKTKLILTSIICILFSNMLFADTPTLILHNDTGLKLNIFTNSIEYTPKMIAIPKGITILRFPKIYPNAAISFLGYTQLNSWARCGVDVAETAPNFQPGELGCQGQHIAFKSTLSGNIYTIFRVK